MIGPGGGAGVDVCCLAWREAPAMLERHHAAVAAALPEGWDGTAVLVENDAPARTSAAARAALVRAYPRARRVVLRAPRNLGYAAAMNLALTECRRPYVALMNSDGAPEPGMLRTLAAALDAHPRALWAAPAVHGPGEPCQPPGPAHPVERLDGMALLIRREPFLALGAFDPLYVFYNEDYDASARVRAAGYALLRVPDAVFRHGKGGRSRRGTFLRELLFAYTAQALAYHHAPARGPAVRALLARRARSLADHARQRHGPELLGIAAATGALPVALARAERRRRSPWDRAQLDAWLAALRPAVERVEL